MKKIDFEHWDRKNTYFHFLEEVPCTYSITVDLDITNFYQRVKQAKIKFFPTLLYGVSKLVNSHEEFRMFLDKDRKPGIYECVHPCYTVFHPEKETFTTVWTEYQDDFSVFYHSYLQDMKQYGEDSGSSKPEDRQNLFNVSCIPWISFSNFHLKLKNGYDYLLPIFTIGKYKKTGEKIMIPLAMEVHHAVCDGFHASRFINQLQEWLNTFEPEI